MSTTLGGCTVVCDGEGRPPTSGSAIDIDFHHDTKRLNEQDARRLVRELAWAIEHAWPVEWRSLYAGPMIAEAGHSTKWLAIATPISWSVIGTSGRGATTGTAEGLEAAKRACEDAIRNAGRLHPDPNKWIFD